MAEEAQLRTEASVRAMFSGIFDLANAENKAWSAYFWRHNYKISLCEQANRILPETDATEIIRRAMTRLRDVLSQLRIVYEEAVHRAELDLYAPDRDDVLFGLVSRQFRMFQVLIDDPKLWSPDIG